MPNGSYWTKEEWEAIEGFFARVGPILSRFAAAHGLTIEKHYHDAPSWSLLFRHTGGGVGKIEVERTSDEHLRIRACWRIDDYQTGTRFLRVEEGKVVDGSTLEQSSALIDTLRMILGWHRDDLTPHGGYKKTWQRHATEEEFERMDSEYSIPRLE